MYSVKICVCVCVYVCMKGEGMNEFICILYRCKSEKNKEKLCE